jgi:hypothetical protein
MLSRSDMAMMATDLWGGQDCEHELPMYASQTNFFVGSQDGEAPDQREAAILGSSGTSWKELAWSYQDVLKLGSTDDSFKDPEVRA